MGAKMKGDKDISRTLPLWYSYATKDHPIEIKALTSFSKGIIQNNYKEQLRKYLAVSAVQSPDSPLI